MKSLCPSEAYEQEQLVLWLEANQYQFCALSPDPGTSAQRAAKRKRMGLRPGWPDLAVLLKRGELLFLELKRVSGGRVSEEQKKVLASLSSAGILNVVARGAEEAKKAILEHETQTS